MIMKILIPFLLLVTNLLHSQEAYILTTKSDTIAIDPGESFYDTGRKIKYYSGNAIFPKTIKTLEVQEIVDGHSIYRVYSFNNNKEHLYKIVAVSPDKTLLARFIEPPANATSGGLGMEYYIVDANFNVITTSEIGTVTSKKRVEQDKQAAEMIFSHFGECNELIEHLGQGIALQPDGTAKPFTENLPLAFKVQKGIIECD